MVGLVLEGAARRLPGGQDDRWDGVPTAVGAESTDPTRRDLH